MVALNPSTSPGSASFTIIVLPLGELIESFTLPLQSTKIPRGICPSTNSTAPCGYAVAYLMFSKACSAVGGRSQKMRSVRSLHVMQLSTISIPYGESMNQPPVTTSGLARWRGLHLAQSTSTSEPASSEVSFRLDGTLGCAARHTPV